MSSSRFEKHLSELTEEHWDSVVAKLADGMHEVDRDATEIWFAFYPLALHNHLENAEDLEKAVQGFVLQGKYKLAESIDDSHRFLYGHRYWADVKHAITARAKSYDGESLDLADEAQMIAKSVAAGAKVDENLVLGIALVGLMTLTQVGLTAVESNLGDPGTPTGIMADSANKIVESRQKEDKQGFFGFLRTIDKEFSVRWDELEKNAKFKVIYHEEIASGSAKDQSRDWGSRDQRCIEGVIPVECRSAACGTCWIGVVGGADRLSDVEKLERKQMKVFGYKQADEAKPNLRLACQAKAEGSVSIVLPPWNGVFGKKLYGVEQVTLKPATKSAEKLREAIADAMGSDNN